MYTYVAGNNHTPTGILFHSLPPVLSEIAYAALGFSQPSTPTGGSSEQNLFANGKWQNIVDTSALFSIGGDRAGSEGSGQYISRVQGSDGVAGSTGGWHLIWGFAMWSQQTNAGGAGSLISRTNISPGNVSFGGFQLASTAHINSSYVLDFINTGTSPTGYVLAGICADASSGSFAYITSASLAGTASRFCALWGSDLSGTQSLINGVPVAQEIWYPTTQVTSALVNNSIQYPFQFLNFPPALRVSTALTTSLTANATTVVPVTSPSLDTYAGFASNTYTVPQTGVYLVSAMVSITDSGANYCHAGVQVNGNNFLGPAYTFTGGTAGVTRPQMTRLLDLRAGDTVKLIAFSSATTTLSNSVGCRLTMKWMAALATANGSVSFTPPDAWFRWQAGTVGNDLPGIFSIAVGNDVNFLVQRPYLLATQGTAQTSLAAGAWQTLTMGPTGYIHSSPGDNYGGWVSGTANYYQAVVPGWYMAVLCANQAAPSGAANHAAGIGYYDSTGTAQGSTPDLYQEIASNNTTGPPGAEAIGLYYLRAGDRLKPMYQEVTGATYSTTILTGHASTFGVVWVSE
jgi:hypothetical protein